MKESQINGSHFVQKSLFLSLSQLRSFSFCLCTYHFEKTDLNYSLVIILFPNKAATKCKRTNEYERSAYKNDIQILSALKYWKCSCLQCNAPNCYNKCWTSQIAYSCHHFVCITYHNHTIPMSTNRKWAHMKHTKNA